METAKVSHPDTPIRVTILEKDGEYYFNNGLRYGTKQEAIDAAKAYLELISKGFS